jgi:hypothetical protein
MAQRKIRVGNTVDVRENLSCASRYSLNYSTSAQVRILDMTIMAVRPPKPWVGYFHCSSWGDFHAKEEDDK